MRRLSLCLLVLVPTLIFSCAQGQRLGRSGEYGPGAGDPGQDDWEDEGEGEHEPDPGSPDPGQGGAGTGGTGSGGGAEGDAGEECAHDPCSVGPALDENCHPCVFDTCGQDPYCCQGEWDDTCVSLATSCSCDGGGPGVGGSDPGGEGGADPGGDGGGDPGGDPDPGGDDPPTGDACAHGLCEVGEPLDFGCEPCVAVMCVLDPYCCTIEWDDVCVGEVADVCPEACL